MARKRSSSFQGVNVRDCDVHAPSFKRVVENTAGDVALVHDMLTGLNSPPANTTIIHSGPPRGCVLGVPLVNQWIGREITITNPATKDTNGGSGRTAFAPLVIRMPPGEAAGGTAGCIFEARARLDDPDQIRETGAPVLEVYNTSMVLQHEIELQIIGGEQDGAVVFHASLDALAASTTHILFPIIDTQELSGNSLTIGFLRSVSVYFRRGIGRSPATPPLRPSIDSLATVTEPTSTQMVFHRDFEETLFGNEETIDGWIVSGLDRNINGIIEAGSGWPAAGNNSYTHVDHDGAGAPDDSDPARSRFFSGTKSLSSGEPAPFFPLCGETFGAHLVSGKFAVDLAEPPTRGWLKWYAPWPITTSLQTFRRWRVVFPDFDAGTSKLKALVLFGSDGDSDVGLWTVTIRTSAGTATASPTAMDGTNDWWLASISSIPFTGDSEGDLDIDLSRGAGGSEAAGEINMLSAFFYFEPN